MDKNAKILITGATGFTGGEVIKFLAEQYGKIQLIGTGRNIAKSQKMRKLGFEMISGDLTNFDFVKSNFSNINYIVHCAAKSDVWGSYESFYKANVIATENLLKLPNLKHFIYISTPSIYFDFSDRFNIKENDTLPSKFVNHYSKTKYLGELLVTNHSASKIKKHIFRPRAIIGAGDETLMPRMIRAYNSDRLKIIGDGKNKGDFTSVKNLAHIIFLALEKEEQTKQIVFNVTDDKPVILWEFINNSLKKLGLDKVNKKVSYKLAYNVASISEWFNKTFSKKEPVLTKYGIGVLNFSLTLNIDAAKSQLGYMPIISSDESIDEFVQWKNKNNKI